MDFSIRNSLTDQIAALRQARNSYAYNKSQSQNRDEPPSTGLVPVSPRGGNDNGTGARLVNETQQDIDGGYRRTRTFANEDGREFTKVEEFTLTERGARRSVVQQNPSGSITRYEEVLDRENTGNFRRTQRFQNESGDIATQITPGYTVNDPFVLSQGNAPASYGTPAAFLPFRGTQLDLRA